MCDKMRYAVLIQYLTNPDLLGSLYENLGINSESEALQIYMKNELSLNSEIFIFEIEETKGELIFERDGVKYFELFPVDHAVNLIEFDLQLKEKGYSDLQIAERLLEYRLNDA
jgi:hypothetical protein